MPRKRALPVPENGFKLPTMVGAVIYVRVSTKEQTENLSLPTQLRACEEYCRRQGYEVLERLHEEGESAKTTDRSQLAQPRSNGGSPSSSKGGSPRPARGADSGAPAAPLGGVISMPPQPASSRCSRRPGGRLASLCPRSLVSPWVRQMEIGNDCRTLSVGHLERV
jgi:hypothetical protein